MNILLYNDLNADQIPGFAKVRKALENNNFQQADVRKIGDNLYRARLNRNDRLLFSLHRYNGESYCLILEYIRNHAYEKSRFLERGVTIDEEKIPAFDASETESSPELTYLNTDHDRFNLLDKIISFDGEQQSVYQLPPPLVIIGSAGSGKTALTLEKMKKTTGDVLYVSHSPFLVQSARNLYYAHHYDNEEQNVEFLSFREFLESIRVPAGREVTLKDFEGWFQRHKGNSKQKDPHKLFEEFRGVLTGPSTESPWLSRAEYLKLGVKQSIFSEEERSGVYDLFDKYRQFLEKEQLYDTNIISHSYLASAEPQYDFIVVDEVQDITNIQLYLILKTLRHPGHFILCGDSNQIVHPNFFSWSKVKTLFFEQQGLTGEGEIIRILQSNYRNAPVITHIANRILKLKHARFGSIDKESNYLVDSIGEHRGQLQLLANSQKVKQDLDSKTARSTRFAVLVMHPDQKAAARQWFNTPLVFSIQEAKGLEYDNIILYNFISDEEKSFRDIAAGVDPAALEKETLEYARAKNKQDKSLEVYKFYINALYVAITRAVSNLYIIEANQKHPLMRLLDLERFTGDLQMDKQDSSLDEWQKEARKLELQGKQEQADEIRSRILQQKPVPWPVLDRTAFTELQKEATSGNNKKKQLLALEYALIHWHRPMLNQLLTSGFKPATQTEEKAVKQLHQKHYMTYDLNNPGSVLRDTEKYGIDHRTIFNLTPLMVAARLGNAALVRELMERGANPDLSGSHGLNALQMALEQALMDERYARHKLAPVYNNLEPDSLSIQAQGRLIKLDKRLMGLFVLNLMFAMFYRKLGELAGRGEGFTAKDITEWVQPLPDEVLPERRKKQSYISSILSGNEVDRDAPYNRKLFKRIRRGHYIINPGMKLRQSEEWVAVHDLLNPEDLGFRPGWMNLDKKDQLIFKDRFEQFDQNRRKNLTAYCEYIGKLQEQAEKELEERRVKSRLDIQSEEVTIG
ncbi:UvrD-helicase domain-containing protein [Thalassotalea sp. G20_0]|uniref:UvrD-helicase domain-containing protein n=1 Tax=Thalassotalea sp. G20_0 TaxID=2821093 RepID=UPI001ADCFDD2|nr:UvrD-helicase domain-containing protein [Thalassotalea sp. G20_0]MBO9495820.1 UvrD-helicase domain-containing protein [Thalassotalea sp. G20_0]